MGKCWRVGWDNTTDDEERDEDDDERGSAKGEEEEGALLADRVVSEDGVRLPTHMAGVIENTIAHATLSPCGLYLQVLVHVRVWGAHTG